jgi:endothelin-converting enzyme/putative endopeptidase
MTPPTVNAYYDPQNNNINFPAGILQPPFYDPNVDNAVNMGGIGAVIGHELTHGFDDQGHQYDGAGNLNDWWTEADQKAFEARAQTLVDQYSQFIVAKDPKDPTKDVKVNGKLTLGENTADNGGIRLSYAAFLKEQAVHPSGTLDGYTAAQRFFLGFGQIWCTNQTEKSAKMQTLTNEHALSRFRVNGTLSNMAEFAQAFSCQGADAMVNKTPARVW